MHTDVEQRFDMQRITGQFMMQVMQPRYWYRKDSVCSNSLPS